MGGPTIALTAGIAAAAVAALAGIAVIAYRVRRSPPSATAPQRALPDTHGVTDPSEDAPYNTEATEAVEAECFKLAFKVPRFDYHIIGEHAQVLEGVGASADESVHQREYFPRRPMLLPRLLQALNDSESTREALVKLIVEDPALAGSVLQRANSAYYRLTPEPVDSLDHAVRALGTEGLRGLLATALLQPVFRLPKGYFDDFAPVTWEQAQRCAAAAEAYAKHVGGIDPFIAQLLGLLGPLARIVLFRLTMEVYRGHPGVLPRAEVFIRSMRLHGARVAGRIAATWELSDPSIAAWQQQLERRAPAAMSGLGRAVYFGELCGGLALLGARGTYSAEGAHAMLAEQSLPLDAAHAVWHAALSADDDQ